MIAYRIGTFGSLIRLAIVLSALVTSNVAFSQSPPTPVETTLPLEQAHADSVWFDADTGKVIPINLPPTNLESSNRDSRWLPKAERVKAPAVAPATTGGGGTGLSIGNAFGWALLALLLTGAVGAVIFGLSKAELDDFASSGSKSRSRLEDAPDEVTIERMKHLPQELRRTGVNLRSEAERLMKEGLFDHAIILLFGHQLLLLDRERFLRLNRGKTNRRYVRECRAKDSAAAQRLSQSVEAFERSYFGKHEIKSREFNELWENNLKLESLVRESSEVAA